MGKLDGRLVLITGASAGIGRAAARAFVAEGARVIGASRNQERLRELGEELGGDAHFVAVAADVSDDASMEHMVAAVGEVGLPDFVIANAGVGLDAPFLETDLEAMRSLFDVNVFGVVRSIRPFLPGMLERGSGRVLLIGSVVGKRGIPGYSAYSASKFALHGMADVLRAELHGSGVSVGIVCPSSTESEFQQRTHRVGNPKRPPRPKRHSAEGVARAIVRMSLSRRAEMLLSPEGKFMVLVDTLAPRLVDAILARVLTKKKA